MDFQPVLALARDIMTPVVVQVSPGTTVREAAGLLLERRIGAAPVVDSAGTVVGMVSEGDLLGRNGVDRLAGQEWWLAMLSEPGHMEAAKIDAARERTVQDVMHTPVVSIEEDGSVQDAAVLLRTQGIKRLPVLSGGRMTGIITRADLLRLVEVLPPRDRASPSAGGLGAMLAGFFGGGSTAHRAATARVEPIAAEPATAEAFRHLVEEADQGKIDEKNTVRHNADLARLEQVKTMLHEHVGDEMWATLMSHARITAAHGGKEIQMLRFPVDLCSDGGRMINNADPAWAETLRGEAAELYARFERELKPAGFGMAARVADYPDGMPGDVALFLVWLN